MSEPKRDDEPTMEEILASIRKIISEDDPDTAEAAPAAPATQGEDAPLDADSVGDEAEPEPEPMELTQMVSEDGSVVDLRAERPAGPASVQEGLVEEEAPGQEAAEAPTQPDRDEESERATVEPLVPQGARVHAELVSEDNDGAQPEPQEPDSESRDAELVLVSEIEPEAESEVATEAGPEDPADTEEAQAVRAAADPESESLVSTEATAAATAAMSRLKDRLAAGVVGGGSDKSIEALARETMAPHLKSWLDQNLPELVERIVREEIEKLVKQTEPR